MRTLPVLVVLACVVTAVPAVAQSTWDKSYSVSGRAAVQINVDNASVAMRGCGECRTVRIHVDAHESDMSRWRVTEMQGGNVVHFDLKRRDSDTFFLGWHGRSPEVTVDLPTESDVELRSGNGALQLADVHGSVEVKTGNGAIQADDLKGVLRISSGNGAVTVHRAVGTLTATSGNGAMTLEGRLSQVEARSGNGSVHVTLEPGTSFTSSSHVTTGHGGISMTVPRELKADIDLSTGSGSVHSDLPVLSQASTERHIHGAANGGGPSLSLHSGAGAITLNTR